MAPSLVATCPATLCGRPQRLSWPTAEPSHARKFLPALRVARRPALCPWFQVGPVARQILMAFVQPAIPSPFLWARLGQKPTGGFPLHSHGLYKPTTGKSPSHQVNPTQVHQPSQSHSESPLNSKNPKVRPKKAHISFGPLPSLEGIGSSPKPNSISGPQTKPHSPPNDRPLFIGPPEAHHLTLDNPPLSTPSPEKFIEPSLENPPSPTTPISPTPLMEKDFDGPPKPPIVGDEHILPSFDFPPCWTSLAIL
ncbi:hypothetical protein AXF42_Ash021297 [Apostasia shenzhenica]|uniref:Uncharacterized protein n=1 Tax=Apostasia shenzhenica TaxID=1088818 RepID=A0A2H9ZYP3_9ASPA|nr:hypothetical protein AXF42_Ash021297 [Apostasia shenzhenica]